MEASVKMLKGLHILCRVVSIKDNFVHIKLGI